MLFPIKDKLDGAGEEDSPLLNKRPASSNSEIDEALDRVGLGFFHVILIIVTGWALASDSVEVLCIGFVSPQLSDIRTNPDLALKPTSVRTRTHTHRSTSHTHMHARTHTHNHRLGHMHAHTHKQTHMHIIPLYRQGRIIVMKAVSLILEQDLAWFLYSVNPSPPPTHTHTVRRRYPGWCYICWNDVWWLFLGQLLRYHRSKVMFNY